MKVGFVTCVRLGLSCMEEIYKIGGRIELAITLHDNIAPNKSGRVFLDDFCVTHKIPLNKIKNINEDEAVIAIKQKELDWLFIIGWSQIAKKEVLEAPKSGCLGMHPTLLPEGRGRAAIPWAILKGLKKTGVTLFKLDENVDTGPIIYQEVIEIDERETAETLYEKVITAHKSLIRKVWPDLERGSIRYYSQDDSKATYWPERKPEDGRISFFMQTDEVDRLIRAVTRPYPGAFIEVADKIYVIWKGEPHFGHYIKENLIIDENNHLWIKTVDGSFESVEWQIFFK